jgi:hypothetical protein
MSRLLHAAARGARVQTLVDIQTSCQCIHCGGKNAFGSEKQVDFTNNMRLGIHRDDEAFQYGPISTALRKFAVNDIPAFSSQFDHMAAAALLANIPEMQTPPSVHHRSLFLLILAESLADEGL